MSGAGRRCRYCRSPHHVSDEVAAENPFCNACLPERIVGAKNLAGIRDRSLRQDHDPGNFGAAGGALDDRRELLKIIDRMGGVYDATIADAQDRLAALSAKLEWANKSLVLVTLSNQDLKMRNRRLTQSCPRPPKPPRKHAE